MHVNRCSTCVCVTSPGGGLLFTFGLNSSGQLGHSPGAHSVAVSCLAFMHVIVAAPNGPLRLSSVRLKCSACQQQCLIVASGTASQL